MQKEIFNNSKFTPTVVCFLAELFLVLSVKEGSRSFGGQFTEITEVPYVVLIQVSVKNGVSKCTGSIIAEDWVLSAAHCFPTTTLSKIKIIGGIDDIDYPEHSQTRVPSKLIIHHKYKKKRLTKWDFALVKVSKFDFKSNRVGILLLEDISWPQSPDKMYNRECLAVGWGLPDHYNKDNKRLHSSRVIAQHGSTACKCLQSYEKKRAICLKRVEEGVGICKGDSGGPLVCDNKGVGVAHYLYDTAKCTFADLPDEVKCGGINTVDVYMFTCPELDWIKSHVLSTPSRPSSCNAVKLYLKTKILSLIFVNTVITRKEELF